MGVAFFKKSDFIISFGILRYIKDIQTTFPFGCVPIYTKKNVIHVMF